MTSAGPEATPDEKPRPLRVLVCIPSHDTWKVEFGMSLVDAVAYFMTNVEVKGGGDKAIAVKSIKSSTLAETRTRLVSWGYRFEATHIMWFDSDMAFPPDTIARLLKHNKPVVAANYVTKEEYSRPVAYKDTDDYVGWVYTKPESTGLEQISLIGMGCMLTDIRIFEQIKLPYFVFEPQGEQKLKQCGEDGYFCSKLYEADIPVYVDHDLSKQVGHIGDWRYRHEQARAASDIKQEEYNALPGSVKIPGANA